MADIYKAIDANDIKHYSTVIHGTPLDEFQTLDDIVKTTPTLAEISGQYETRFTGIYYYLPSS